MQEEFAQVADPKTGDLWLTTDNFPVRVLDVRPNSVKYYYPYTSGSFYSGEHWVSRQGWEKLVGRI